jgi:hypothetical protein
VTQVSPWAAALMVVEQGGQAWYKERMLNWHLRGGVSRVADWRSGRVVCRISWRHG